MSNILKEDTLKPGIMHILSIDEWFLKYIQEVKISSNINLSHTFCGPEHSCDTDEEVKIFLTQISFFPLIAIKAACESEK